MARQKIELAAEEAEELSRRARATTVSVRDRFESARAIFSTKISTKLVDIFRSVLMVHADQLFDYVLPQRMTIFVTDDVTTL